jgi:protein-tyrosine phosphatase
VSRALQWEGCANVRDLGGVPLARGGETRYGVLVRADNVRRLTETGWSDLYEHGVRRIVDLRWREELANDPPREVDIDVVHVSLLGELDPDFVDDRRSRDLPGELRHRDRGDRRRA